jgi:dTDP-4-amino-4,6-dideoxy-D-galactose acyltransferase
MSMPSPDPCDFLTWDSDFFQHRIARVRGDTLAQEPMAKVDAWCREKEIQCLYFLARADDPRTIRTAEENGFRLTDMRVTFQRKFESAERLPSTGPESSAVIREVRQEDLAELQDLARTMHGQTRFFNDGHFLRQRAEAMYSTWIALECEGRAQKVLVAVSPADRPLGYISCHLDPKSGLGEIGLVGVNREARGKSLGRSLVLAALEWFRAQAAREVTVVTQGGNVPAQRLYQRCGFLLQDFQLWYHKWYSLPEAGPSARREIAGGASAARNPELAVVGKKNSESRSGST